MRAKNEFRLISEAYNIKLLAEKAVDGTLMCSKDCCGSPVMECKCGDDCPHCNCFMIQKAVKDFGLKSPLLEGIVPEDERDEPIRNRELPVGHYDHMVRLSRGGKWNTHSVQVRKTEPELIQKFLDQGFRIEKPPAEDYERFQNPYDDYVDDDAREQARRDDELMGDIKVDPNDKPEGLEDMKKRMAALDREIKMAHARGREDNEHPEDSMYIKDPEELKKALIWHHGNYARLRNKSMRGEQLTDEEYDSLKHSEGELDLHDQLER